MLLMLLSTPVRAFEISAAVHLGDASGSDRVLMAILAVQAILSAVAAIAAVASLPERLSAQRALALSFFFAAGFAVPLLGPLAVIAMVWIVRHLVPREPKAVFDAIALPDFDPHRSPGGAFAQSGMRAFLANARVPLDGRLRALVALQNISGHVASPLLREVLADPSEDVRLLAYGMLDAREKHLNAAIHHESARFAAAPPESPVHIEATRRLADLYWELVYQELVQGDLRTHALEESLRFTAMTLAHTPDDAALHLRLGRLRQSLGDPIAACAAYERAQMLGMPETRIVPYLAEAAFDLRDYVRVRALLDRLGDWQVMPRLAAVIRYWRRP